jgi:hypothetical protein
MHSDFLKSCAGVPNCPAPIVPRSTSTVIKPHMIVTFKFLIVLCNRLPFGVDRSLLKKLELEAEEEEEAAAAAAAAGDMIDGCRH